MDIDKAELDQHITGNWGEDSVPKNPSDEVAVDNIAEVMWTHEEVMFRINGMSWEQVVRAKRTDPGMQNWCDMRDTMRDRARAVLQALVDWGVL
jgi:hypothetical protein